MNVLKKGHVYWRNPWQAIKIYSRRVKWAWQRITKGYADCDLWDMDNFLANMLWHSLDELADFGQSWCDSKFETYEEWEEYLHDTANCFRLTLEDEHPTPAADAWFKALPNNWPSNYDSEELIEKRQAMNDEWQSIRRSMYVNKDEGLDRLGYIWFDLWD